MAIKQMLTAPQKTHPFGVAGTQTFRSKLETNTEITGNVDWEGGRRAMMEDHADDDAGETSAAKSKSQPVKHSEQDIASPEACGHYS